MWWLPIFAIWFVESLGVGFHLYAQSLAPELSGFCLARLLEITISICLVFSQIRVFGHDEVLDRIFRRTYLFYLTILLTIPIISVIFLYSVTPNSERLQPMMVIWQLVVWIRAAFMSMVFPASKLWAVNGAHDIRLAWYYIRTQPSVPFHEWVTWTYVFRASRAAPIDAAVKDEYEIGRAIWTLAQQWDPVPGV